MYRLAANLAAEPDAMRGRGKCCGNLLLSTGMWYDTGCTRNKRARQAIIRRSQIMMNQSSMTGAERLACMDEDSRVGGQRTRQTAVAVGTETIPRVLHYSSTVATAVAVGRTVPLAYLREKKCRGKKTSAGTNEQPLTRDKIRENGEQSQIGLMWPHNRDDSRRKARS